MCRNPNLVIGIVLSTGVSFGAIQQAHAENIAISSSCNVSSVIDGSRIQSVKINGKWIPQELIATVNELLPLNSVYDPSRVTAAVNAVQAHLDSIPLDLRNARYSIAYAVPRACKVPSTNGDKAIEVTISPYYLQVDLVSTGRNILPIPRVNTPDFSAGIPPLLSKLSPSLTGTSDRSFGPSLQLQTSTNLSKAFSSRTETGVDAKTPYNLDLVFRKSINNSYYDLDTSISYATPIYASRFSPYGVLRYTNKLTPLGESRNWSETSLIDLGLLRLQDKGPVRTYLLGVKGRFLSNYAEGVSELPISNSSSENGLEAYILGDLRMSRGVARIGVWGDIGNPSKSSTYQRTAIQAGYATEIGKGHNTLGIQILTSAGYIWGSPPQYGRFYGGTQSSDFLYDSFPASDIRRFPAGPTLRSFGETQAGVRQSNGLTLGATSYWGISLTAYIPIPGWSRPLIPDIKDEDGTSARDAIMSAVNSSQSNLAFKLFQDGLSQEEAERKSALIFDKEVRPAVSQLVDNVNIFSIRPFVAFDLAQLGASSASFEFSKATYAGLGGGLQANLVNASLEMGYMQSIAPSSASFGGNFFLRFIVKDIF